MVDVDPTAVFVAERPRLVSIATRLLGDHFEAEDVVQQAWLRLQRGPGQLDSVPAWLTTVTTRLCWDRLRSRAPVPSAEIDAAETGSDAGDDVGLAETVGVALQAVLDRLSPRERVAFVLHDSFSFDFGTIGAILDTTPAAARKLASRARAKVGQPGPDDALDDWEIVDAFMDAARNGEFDRLLGLLAPDAAVSADDIAVEVGTPHRIDGPRPVAEFFNGSAKAALAVYVGSRPGAAWFHRGAPRVVFDFTIRGQKVAHITFRAEPDVLAQVRRR